MAVMGFVFGMIAIFYIVDIQKEMKELKSRIAELEEKNKKQ